MTIGCAPAMARMIGLRSAARPFAEFVLDSSVVDGIVMVDLGEDGPAEAE